MGDFPASHLSFQSRIRNTWSIEVVTEVDICKKVQIPVDMDTWINLYIRIFLTHGRGTCVPYVIHTHTHICIQIYIHVFFEVDLHISYRRLSRISVWSWSVFDALQVEDTGEISSISDAWILEKMDLNHGSLHPGRLRWNIIMEVWKMIFLSNWLICRFHVNLPGWNWAYLSLAAKLSAELLSVQWDF